MLTTTGFFIGPLYPVGLFVLIQVIPKELHIGALGMYPAVMGTALLTLLQASAPALGKLDRLRSLFLQVPWPRKPVSKFYNLL